MLFWGQVFDAVPDLVPADQLSEQNPGEVEVAVGGNPGWNRPDCRQEPLGAIWKAVNQQELLRETTGTSALPAPFCISAHPRPSDALIPMYLFCVALPSRMQALEGPVAFTFLFTPVSPRTQHVRRGHG